jgi:N-acetylmuramoyl-L-alanine amidase
LVKCKNIFLLILLAALFAASVANAVTYDKARAEYQSLNADEKRNSSAEEWRLLAKTYAAAGKSNSDKRDDAIYMYGICYDKAWKISGLEEDFTAASDNYLKIAKSFRKSNLADDGLFRAAALWERKGDVKKQKELLQRILKEYPKSDMAGTAKKRIKEAGKGTFLSKVRYWSAPAYTRIIFELGGRASFVAEALPEDPLNNKPARIFVDLTKVKLAGGCLENGTVSDGLVTRIRVGQYSQDTARVVLDLDAPAKYTIFPLLDPYRVVIDVFHDPQMKSDADIVAHLIEESKVCKAPTEEERHQILALDDLPLRPDPSIPVAPVAASAQPAVSIPEVAGRELSEEKADLLKLMPPEPKPAAPIESVKTAAAPEPVKVPQEIPQPAAESAKAPEEKPAIVEEKPLMIDESGPVVASLALPPVTDIIVAQQSKQETPQKEIRILIDPGHGGTDPGAIGKSGLMEKNVTLEIAKALKDLLKTTMPCVIKLTREKDETLSLASRTAMANAFGADLFISIHANASRSRKARGIETYYLDRSSDRSARKVAAMENANSEDTVAETEHLLADVLLGMKVPESQRLAKIIQSELVAAVAKKHGSVRNLGVKRAPFYVLTGAVMPSVLVETAFISNAKEEQLLGSAAYRESVATAITGAVAKFLK